MPPAERKRQVVEVARRVELDALLARLPKELSGGQRQRVALARAIIRTPRVFLMDEPLSNLDAKLRVQMRAELKHLQHELQVTTIYVTHDQIEAMTLAHRVAVMNKGVIEQLGTPKEIYNDPRTLFVAGFIGSPPMNLIDGRGRRTASSPAPAASGSSGLGRANVAARRARRAARGRPRGRRQQRRRQRHGADLFGRTDRREHAGQRARRRPPADHARRQEFRRRFRSDRRRPHRVGAGVPVRRREREVVSISRVLAALVVVASRHGRSRPPTTRSPAIR